MFTCWKITLIWNTACKGKFAQSVHSINRQSYSYEHVNAQSVCSPISACDIRTKPHTFVARLHIDLDCTELSANLEGRPV